MNNPCGLLEVAIMVSIHNDIARWFKSTVECIIVVNVRTSSGNLAGMLVPWREPLLAQYKSSKKHRMRYRFKLYTRV